MANVSVNTPKVQSIQYASAVASNFAKRNCGTVLVDQQPFFRFEESLGQICKPSYVVNSLWNRDDWLELDAITRGGERCISR